MKIIDNKKDYYDYLVGIYGMDEKMVYDRRKSVKVQDGVLKSGWHVINVSDIIGLTVRVGYLVYHSIHKDKITDEWVIPEKVTSSSDYYTKVDNPVRITNGELNRFVPYKREWNSKKGWVMAYDDATPVSIIITYTVGRAQETLVIADPILTTFPAIAKFIPADTAWMEIYNFISSQYDKEIIDNRNDVQKLESAGFDKKTSFRNVK